MKTNSWFILTILCSLGAGAGFSAQPAHSHKAATHKATSAKPSTTAATPAPAPAPTLEPGPATVTQDHVNVRARADVDSEVVAHLKKNDSVTVIEEVLLKKPSAGEPARWAKISLPSDVAVWVYADFLDKSASQVKVAKLNLRAGPGENYGVLGTLEKGASVKKLESKGDWWKVEAPSGSFAFVAANLLAPKPASAEPAPAPKPAAAPVVAAAKPRPSAVPPPVTAINVDPSPVAPAPRPAQVFVPQPPPVFNPAPAPVVATPAPAPKPAPVVTPPPTTPTPILSREPGEIDIRPMREDAYIKRIVTREGVVRRTLNIQAPTFLVLENLHNGRVMNYLYSTSTNLNLSSYRGRTVTVTGEEALDERWPNIPVIRVETLRTAP